MAIGGGVGIFAAGMAERQDELRTLGLKEEQLGIASRRLQFDKAKQESGVVRATLDGLLEQALEVRKLGGPPEMLKLLENSAIKTLQMANVKQTMGIGEWQSEINTYRARVASQVTDKQAKVGEAEGEFDAAARQNELIEAAPEDQQQAISRKLGFSSGRGGPQIRNFDFPNGETFAVDITDPVALRAALDRKGTISTTSIQGTRSEVFGAQKIEVRDITEAETFTRIVLNETGRLREQLQAGNTFTGIVGSGVQLFSSAVAQAQQIAALVGGTAFIGGKQVSESELLGFEYDFGSFGAAASSRAFRSNVINLTYMMARAAEPGGRLTENDVQKQLTRLGTNSGDPEQILAALDEVDRASLFALRTRWDVLNRRADNALGEFPGDLDALMQGGGAPSAGAALSAHDRAMLARPSIDDLSADELNAMSDDGLKALATQELARTGRTIQFNFTTR